MKKRILVITAVLVALIGQAKAVLMDVSRVVHISAAGGQGSELFFGSSEGFGTAGTEAWRQQMSIPMLFGGSVLEGTSFGGVGGYYPGDGSAANQGWTFQNSGAGMSWTGRLQMYGIASNTSEFGFTLFEPVAYSLGLDTDFYGNVVNFSRSSNLGSSGFLDTGAYTFRYAESLQEGATNGVVNLRFVSVPEGGSTFWMFGIGLVAILMIRIRRVNE